MSVHPPHPRCPSCGKALYKSDEPGAVVKKSDPWSFCRNLECSSKKTQKNKPPVVETEQDEAKRPTLSRRSRRLKSQEKEQGGLVRPKIELEAVKARLAVRGWISSQPSRDGLYCFIAMVLQEIGQNSAANAMIDSLGLEKLGVLKISLPVGIETGERVVK